RLADRRPRRRGARSPPGSRAAGRSAPPRLQAPETRRRRSPAGVSIPRTWPPSSGSGGSAVSPAWKRSVRSQRVFDTPGATSPDTRGRPPARPPRPPVARGRRHRHAASRPALEGRVLFTNAEPGSADAAFVKKNDPTGDPDVIPDLVRAGYLVRTRADADTLQARSGDVTDRDAALASGAQAVSTDYPVENSAFGTGYRVQIPGGHIARCNPVNAPPGCRDAGLE